MNVRQALRMVGAFGLLAGSSLAATTLPYAQGFEDGWPADGHWSGSGVAVAAPAENLLPGAGTKALLIDNDTATLSVDAAQDNKNVWIQVYAKPVRGDELSPPAIADAAGAFFISNDGRLVARNGGVWETFGTAGDFPAGQYYGFIVHAKFNGSGSGTYDIYKTTETAPYKTPMTLVNPTPLVFNTASASTKLSAVKIQSGNPAVVDAVAVSRASIDPGTTADRVAVYEHRYRADATEFTLPAYSDRYKVDAAARSLTGAVGLDILSGLLADDKLIVWTGAGQQEVAVSGGAFTTPPAVEIGTMTSMLIRNDQLPAGSRNDTFGFYAYQQSEVVAVGGVLNEAGAQDFQESCELNGTGQENGWTALNPSLPADTDINSASFPFNDPADFDDGDFLFISLDDTPNSWTVYEWEASPGYWKKRLGSIPVNPVPTGANMWVKRLSDPLPATVTITY